MVSERYLGLIAREYTRQMASSYSSIPLEEPIVPDDSNIINMSNEEFQSCLKSGLFSILPNPYKFNKINYGETNMDSTERKEQLEQFKKEELFLVAEKNNYGVSTFLTTKNNIPGFIKAGCRIFKLNALKEVTNAEVVVE